MNQKTSLFWWLLLLQVCRVSVARPFGFSREVRCVILREISALRKYDVDCSKHVCSLNMAWVPLCWALLSLKQPWEGAFALFSLGMREVTGAEGPPRLWVEDQASGPGRSLLCTQRPPPTPPAVFSSVSFCVDTYFHCSGYRPRRTAGSYGNCV